MGLRPGKPAPARAAGIKRLLGVWGGETALREQGGGSPPTLTPFRSPPPAFHAITGARKATGEDNGTGVLRPGDDGFTPGKTCSVRAAGMKEVAGVWGRENRPPGARAVVPHLPAHTPFGPRRLPSARVGSKQPVRITARTVLRPSDDGFTPGKTCSGTGGGIKGCWGSWGGVLVEQVSQRPEEIAVATVICRPMKLLTRSSRSP